MKKQYKHPTLRVYTITQRTAILTVSGNIPDGNKLDNQSGSDPEGGEPMGVKGATRGLWSDEW